MEEIQTEPMEKFEVDYKKNKIENLISSFPYYQYSEGRNRKKFFQAHQLPKNRILPLGFS